LRVSRSSAGRALSALRDWASKRQLRLTRCGIEGMAASNRICRRGDTHERRRRHLRNSRGLKMRGAATEDEFAQMNVTEEEMRAYQKVASLMAGRTANTHYSPLEPGALGNPYPIYHQLQSQHPIYADPRFGWVISRYADVAAVLRDPYLSTPSVTPDVPIPEPLQAVADEVRELRRYLRLIVEGTGPAEHGRLRSLVVKGLSPQIAERKRESIQNIVDDLLNSVCDRRHMDVISEFAFKLPIMIIAKLLSIPESDFNFFQDLAGDITAVFGLLPDSEYTVTIRQAHRRQQELVDYLRHTVVSRRGNPNDDLISKLIGATRYDNGLNDEQVVAKCVHLILAGHETTMNLIGNATLTLLRHPSQLRTLLEEQSLIPTALEELLRFESPVQAIVRQAMTDRVIRGHLVLRGEHILVLLGAANRDPFEFSQPDQLNVRRQANRHIAFGHGPHFCPGVSIARLAGQIAIQSLFERFPTLRLVDDTPRWRDNFYLRGLIELPVAW
jgi:cytochrome P450